MTQINTTAYEMLSRRNVRVFHFIYEIYLI